MKPPKTLSKASVYFSAAFASLLFITSPNLRAVDPYTPELIEGNTFIYRTSGSQSTSASRGVFIRFTATETTSANSLALYLGSATASSLTFGLQADNGSGAPSGTFLASGTIAPTTGWNSISFANQSLVAGQVYHLVVLPTAVGSASLRTLQSYVGLPFTSQTYGIKDSNYAFGLINSGTPATPTNESALPFVVGTTDGKGMGMAYYNVSTPTLSATTPYAQRFRFTTGGSNQTATLDSITVRLSAGADNLHNVQLTLLDDTNAILATKALDSSSITLSSTGDYTVNFSDGPVLKDGSYYRLALTVEGGGTNTIKWLADVTGSTNNTINSATFQGLDGYAFSYSDTTFATPQGIAYGNDYVFSYTSTAIPEPATTALAIVAFTLTGRMLRRSRG